MRLVKQTVNDDDRNARHLIFGDAEGRPGTLVTCLEYPDLDEGTVGRGSTHHFALAVESDEELTAWRDYLESRGIAATEVMDRTTSSRSTCATPTATSSRSQRQGRAGAAGLSPAALARAPVRRPSDAPSRVAQRRSRGGGRQFLPGRSLR